MKKLFKGVLVKILSAVVIVALLAVGVIVVKNVLKPSHQTQSTILMLQERLEKTAELNTASYFCTDMITSEDSKTIKNIKIPLTGKKFIQKIKTALLYVQIQANF